MKWENAQPGDLILVQLMRSPPDGLIFVIGNSNRYSGERYMYMNVVFFSSDGSSNYINLSVGRGSKEHVNLQIISRKNG